MTPEQTEKAELRRIYNARRRALSREEWRRMSDALCRRIEQSSLYERADTLLTYVSAKDNEVDTHDLIDRALTAGKRVLVPVTGNWGRELRWSLLRRRSDLARGRLDLLEPKPEALRLITPPDWGLCLAPGIVFTPEGYRIGYGGGYYDRFLKEFGGTSIGLAFELQVASEIPVAPHDIPVDCVATENRWYGALPQ